MTVCVVDGCSREARALSMCSSHYMRQRRWGDPTAIKRMRGPALERFTHMYAVNEANGCWEWRGVLDKRGYGRFIDENGSADMAHRWSYKHFVGAIPENLVVHHKCFNPKCVNPDHLEPATHRENIIEKGATNAAHVNSLKTHCIRGHSLADAYIQNTRWGKQRICRTCQKDRTRKYKEKRSLHA